MTAVKMICGCSSFGNNKKKKISEKGLLDHSNLALLVCYVTSDHSSGLVTTTHNCCLFNITVLLLLVNVNFCCASSYFPVTH